MNLCRICDNNGVKCKECDSYKNKFEPKNEYYKFFSRSSNGTEETYHFNTTDEDLRITTSVSGGICPYCGESMFYVQDRETLRTLGRTCLCDGAMAELEYLDKMRELKKKHQDDLIKLQNEYSDRLQYNKEKLFDIMINRLKKDFEWHKDSKVGFTTTINGEKLNTIEDICK